MGFSGLCPCCWEAASLETTTKRPSLPRSFLVLARKAWECPDLGNGDAGRVGQSPRERVQYGREREAGGVALVETGCRCREGSGPASAVPVKGQPSEGVRW